MPRLLAGILMLGVFAPARAQAVDCTPSRVVIERFVDIENRFGERIATDLYFPADAAGAKLTDQGCTYPVVLESSPYRDWTSPQPTKVDEDARRTWWVERGYVYAFADVPGSGGSDGTWCLFCLHEQLSGVDVVNALGAMPWSNGNVGMTGGSYPGINALLVAQHRPAHLKAVIAANVLEDLYSDMFFVGGMRRGEDAAVLTAAFTALSRWTGRYDAGDPERSADLAAQRATRDDLSFMTIQDDHPTRDDFYVERSVRPADIEVPVFLIGGWNDIFDRATWSMYDRLGSRHKVLVQGPFTHVSVWMPPNANLCTAPNQQNCGYPMFERFLKGNTTPEWDAYAAQPVRWYEQPNHGYRAGATKPTTSPYAIDLGTGHATLDHRPSGATSGRWFTRGSVPGAYPPFDTYLGVDGPADQRVEGATALSFVSEPLAADVTLAGGGTLTLRVTADAPDADLVVRVVDEYPAGQAPFPAGHGTLVTSGWLRASHRGGHTQPEPLQPGVPTDLEVEIWPSGYRFAAGHRIRIDVSPSDVPRFVPLAHPFTLDVDLDASTLRLDVLG